MINTILLLLLIAQPSLQPVDPSLAIPVLKGRAAVNEFRKAHEKMYSQLKTAEARSQQHNKLMGIMTWELSQAGYTSVDDFTKSSELMNVKQLGFEDKKDFDEKKTTSDSADYIDMWH